MNKPNKTTNKLNKERVLNNGKEFDASRTKGDNDPQGH